MSNTLITKDAILYSNNFSQTDILPHPGTVVMWSGSIAPKNALFCNGDPVSKENYPDLFDVIGFRYGGSGDNFNLPDFTDRYLFGTDTMTNTDSTSYGNWKIQHFNHTHNIDFSSIPNTISSGGRVEFGSRGAARYFPYRHTINFTVHNNTTDTKDSYRPRYTLCNWIIYY